MSFQCDVDGTLLRGERFKFFPLECGWTFTLLQSRVQQKCHSMTLQARSGQEIGLLRASLFPELLRKKSGRPKVIIYGKTI